MKLYKKDSKGKIRVLHFFTKDNKLITESGLVDGNLVTNERVCKGKNIGRSNKTTAIEQAKLEMESKIKDKLTQGYFKTVEEAESKEFISPMLAKDYKKEAHKINWEKDKIYAQPKLDGMRCLAYIIDGKVEKLESRDGKIITDNTDALEHIIKDINDSDLKCSVILDGELYAHGYSFQENMELIKKKRENSIDVKFHVYDRIEPVPYESRYILLRANEISLKTELNHVQFVTTKELLDEEHIKKLHSKFLKEGYEGTILRVSNEKDTYKVNGRSSNLLKYKDFKDIACKIVEIGPAKRRPTWGRPVVEWQGKQFACGTKMSHKEREELLTNKSNYIGKTAEIRYFEESDTGIPRFPVMVGIRLDK